MSYASLGAFPDPGCGVDARTGTKAPDVFFERICVNLRDPRTMAELKRLMVDRVQRPMVDSTMWTPMDEQVLLDWAGSRESLAQRSASGWAYPTEATLVELLGHCFVFEQDVTWERQVRYRNVCDGAYPVLEPLVHYALAEKPRRERLELVAPAFGMPSQVRWIGAQAPPDGGEPPGPEPQPEPGDEPVEAGAAAGSGLGLLMAAAGVTLGALALFRPRRGSIWP